MIERKDAFESWKAQRETLAHLLSHELNDIKTKPDLSKSESQYKKYLELVLEREDLIDITNEVSDQIEFRDFRELKAMDQQMYTFSSALVVLGIELGANPHTGCRSGKDRTSLQRMEVALRYLQRKIYGRHLNYREIEQAKETRMIREELLLNSGHIDDLAIINTGSKGLTPEGFYGSYVKDIDSEGNTYNSWFEKVVLGGAYKAFIREIKYAA